MSTIHIGPFSITQAARGLHYGGLPHHRWTLYYGLREMAMKTLPDSYTSAEVRDEFSGVIAEFIVDSRRRFAPDVLELVTDEGETVLARLSVNRLPEGFSGCMPDDRFPYWLLTASRPRLGFPVTLSEYTSLAVELSAPPLAWITGLLPGEVLTQDAEEWRPPTSWELRHVVGEGSFTGVSGAAAAALLGMSATNFRKYTAGDSAANRQKISFAAWHYLLDRLGVKRAS
ncbi:hypothetical protein [Pseudomonas aeruginosa]|uniref:hypothetical protein n=1 Tax=Pseudomonas aeruginosa TaxID=287 RepID=UPI001573A84E|nr:hypothetical protein [Pseudomonas aeruginosa]MBG4997641.1 hypothetical protein [Pseudomonas aeruginosa]MCO3258884.1 hypothetical protein [Pseudomonas aeruginosa]NTT95168.1 hypothetical protein [Pseudomonas aeruginosa]QUI48331.1 hypothetical protein JBL36_19060 [Pseudomonas aeruginosa]QUI53953.1 hypothetical protein JBL37_15790 [Pseudomonas aeruginosa]